MTIHDFDFDSYVQLVERARGILPKSVRLVSNTGDLEDWQAKELRSAGIDSAYHALRLREGIDNHLEPMERYRTIQNLRAAKIKVMSGIEPIGPEHTAKEIVNGFFQSFEFGCENCSASAREPVAGTPLFSYGHISFKRLQRIRSALLLGSLGLRERRFYGGVYGGFEKVLCEYSHSPKDLEDRSELGLGRTVAWARAVLKSQGYIKIRCVDGSEEDL